jgi:hypothetical protein
MSFQIVEEGVDARTRAGMTAFNSIVLSVSFQMAIDLIP